MEEARLTSVVLQTGSV